MTTVFDATNATTEAVKGIQDAARRYVDESNAVGLLYYQAWSATIQAATRTAFDLQNRYMEISRALLDSAIEANRSWMDQGAELVRKGQDTATRVAASSLELAEASMPGSRI